MKARALPVSIFEDKRIGNCSNHGISERFREALLLCDEGFIDVDLDNPPGNLVVYVKRTLWGEEHDFVRPYAEPKGAGWMNGGSIIWTCDSRFPGNHPVCFHDRDETWEEYELLSR